MQSTLTRPIRLEGVGLHSGRMTSLHLTPAPAGFGVRFMRIDLPSRPVLPARFDLVEQTPLCTRLAGPDGVKVSTVEHIMSAVAGLGIDNLLVEIDGPEIPILDGSALPFVEAILEAGIAKLDAPRSVIRLCAPVMIARGASWARLDPSSSPLFDVSIDFPDGAIGQQGARFAPARESYRDLVAPARTFCRIGDVEAMRKAGLALGGTLDNALVVDGEKILSPGGLRFANEPARHKLLDAMGDLALSGPPLVAAFRAHRPSHALTNTLLRKLMAQSDAWSVKHLSIDAAANLVAA